MSDKASDKNKPKTVRIDMRTGQYEFDFLGDIVPFRPVNTIDLSGEHIKQINWLLEDLLKRVARNEVHSVAGIMLTNSEGVLSFYSKTAFEDVYRTIGGLTALQVMFSNYTMQTLDDEEFDDEQDE